MNKIIVKNAPCTACKLEIYQISNKILNLFEQNNKIVEIDFANPEKIKEINKKYRNINQVTDVLSFSYQQIPSKINILGSIIICLEYGKKLNYKAKDLAIHGLMHLLNFDHDKDKEKWDGTLKFINSNI